MTDRLRADRGRTGLVTAVGWYLTKHAAGIYSTTPPETAFSTAVKIDEPPAERSVVTESGTEYDAVAETATVIYERDGSRSFGILASLIEDGSRVLRSSTDPAVLEWLDSGAPVTGRRVKLEAGGGVRPSA